MYLVLITIFYALMAIMGTTPAPRQSAKLAAVFLAESVDRFIGIARAAGNLISNCVATWRAPRPCWPAEIIEKAEAAAAGAAD
jgi:hypothetical protein